MKFDKALMILRNLLKRPNGAEPYKEYIEVYLAKDFASEVALKIKELETNLNTAIKIAKEGMERMHRYGEFQRYLIIKDKLKELTQPKETNGKTKTK